ncbi:MAG TPA: methyl-accepting chemotaxis protein [Sedimenticola sp.]|nr:methyl-accepting chemotaxis protein [Sedimenticola sp.]
MNKFFKNLSVRAKLMGNAGILLTLLILGSGYAIYSMNQIGHELSTITEHDIPLTEKLGGITTHQLEQAIQFERALHYAGILQQDDTAARFREALKAFDEGIKQINDEILEAEIIAEAAMEGAQGDTLKELKSASNALKGIGEEYKSYIEHAHTIFSLLEEGDNHAAEQLAKKVIHEEEQLNKEVASLLRKVGQFTEASSQSAEAHEKTTISVLTVIAIVSIILGMVTSLFTANLIVNAIRRATVTASGDLTQPIEVDSKDEIGELLTAMNGMRKKLLGMLSEISDTTAQLSTASEEMSVVTSQTSQTIQEQRTETEQVATAMAEMTATVREVASNITLTSTSANEANEQTIEGARVVQQTIKQINELAEQLEISAQTINEVDQQCEAISAVLDVIKGIAEQTNLLALNAAIEAARAGEQGRGFAVVADEVRTLAGRTQQSTEEINDIIGKLQNGSCRAVAVMEQSREQSKAAVDYAAKSGEVLTVIAEAVSKISQMGIQISSAAEEQSAVSEEINRNIVKINNMSAETATGAAQTAQVSQDLAAMATELRGLVGQFQV